MNIPTKNLISWLLYDFGNSFYVTAISGLFLAQWIILDNKIDDIWYAAAFALATLLVLISSPFFGAWSDRIGKRMPFLKWISILLFIFNGLIAVVAVSDLPMKTRAIIVLCLAVIVQYFYQMSLIFYNALLKNVSTEKNRGKISGLGEGFNSAGWLLASLILLPFATGAITLIGYPGRHQVFIPAFIISTLVMLPMLFLFKEKSQVIIKKSTKQNTVKLTLKGIKDLFKKDRNVGIFLVAFSLISDIILTLNLFFAIVMGALYGVDDTIKTIIFAINLGSMIIFGYLFGVLGDKFSHKRILVASCMMLIAIMSLFFLSSSVSVLYIIAILGGAGAGGYYVVSRSLMIKISPQNRLGEYFGFYSTFSRMASIIAPLVWGVIILMLKNTDALKYQVAGMTMVAFLIIGTIILLNVNEKNAEIKYA
jgi:MFS transporter, UMF1 family